MPEVGSVCVAEDSDFEDLKRLVTETEKDGWKLEYSKSTTRVWMKSSQYSNFKVLKVSFVLSFKVIYVSIYTF
jgi:hypothetical protein